MNTNFGTLGVRIVDSDVWSEGKRIGPLAGARAEVIAGRARPGMALLGMAAFGLAGADTLGARRSFVLVTLADGTVCESRMEGRWATKTAQVEAARFNALARAAKQAR